MKKWWAACLLAIGLLCVATSAMAGHTRLNGDYCKGSSFQIRESKTTEEYHTLYCFHCEEEFTENHWSTDTPRYKATCIKLALCTSCATTYGEYGPHDWGEWKPYGYAKHIRTCNNSSLHTQTQDCTFSVAPCTESVACTECGVSYKLGHDWGIWEPTGNKTHRRVCKRDSSHIDPGTCSNLLEADCVSPAMCMVCRAEYGEPDLSKHSWDMWISNGNGTHTRTCSRDKRHTETEACSGDSCGETYCNVCYKEFTADHKFDGPWSSDDSNHWRSCIYCNTEGPKASHSFSEIVDEKYLKSKATCVSPAVYYWNCVDCGHLVSGFTNGDIDPNNHDLIPHAGKAATCTETGWENYYTCSRCGFSSEGAAIPKRGHWYGQWTANGNGTHAAACRRDGCRDEKTVACESIAVPSLNVSLCPVCGVVSDGAHLALTDASVKTPGGKAPRGEAVLRLGALQSGEQLLSVGFEYDGRLTQPTGQTEITLPAAVLNGYALMLLDADGAEAALPCTLNGGEATFTLDFAAGENLALMLRLVPAS